jgi:hypothetical protein
MEPLIHAALRFILCFYGILLILGPIVLRIQFRYRAKVDPRVVPIEELPAEARQFMELRVASLVPWNFDLVAYLNLGSVTKGTEAFVALLSNSHTGEWADVSFVASKAKSAGYVEFITRCSEEVQIDTNTSATPSALFSTRQHHVFRFPQTQDVFTLYRIHRLLVTQITHGALPVLPPPGQEVAELKRRLERYGPWQQKNGYMYLGADGENYRLTWKGAILAAWRAIWPVPLFRGWRMRMENQAVLNKIGVAT